MQHNRLFMQENKNNTVYKLSLRDKILDTAMIMFTSKGIRAVKMDDIANSLQISKRTLYELYSDKEHLLLEGLKKHINLRSAEMHKMAEEKDNVMDIILEVFLRKVDEFKKTDPQFYDDILRYPEVTKYFQQDKEHAQEQMESFMKRGVAEGYFRENVNYELICTMFDLQHKIIMSNRMYNKYSMHEILDSFIFVFLRGVCTKKGIDVLDAFKD